MVNAVGVVIRLGLGVKNRGSTIDRVKIKFIFSPKLPDWLRGQPKCILNGNQDSFPGVKGSKREANHSPSSRTQLEKG